jgi:hypothetical protein
MAAYVRTHHGLPGYTPQHLSAFAQGLMTAWPELIWILLPELRRGWDRWVAARLPAQP